MLIKQFIIIIKNPGIGRNLLLLKGRQLGLNKEETSQRLMVARLNSSAATRSAVRGRRSKFKSLKRGNKACAAEDVAYCSKADGQRNQPDASVPTWKRVKLWQVS